MIGKYIQTKKEKEHMILEYHRPTTINQALKLLERDHPKSIPIAGGTTISRWTYREDVAVVDLQLLGFNKVNKKGNTISIGSMVTLQEMLEMDEIQPSIKEAIQLEATQNIRNRATVAGTLVTADGKSPFCLSMLALEAQLRWLPGQKYISLGDWLALAKTHQPGVMIDSIEIPKSAVLRIAYINRTPKDRPLLSMALAIWPSGRTRIVLGGTGDAPVLASDGMEDAIKVEEAIIAHSHIYNNAFSKDYSNHCLKTLIKRLFSI